MSDKLREIIYKTWCTKEGLVLPRISDLEKTISEISQHYISREEVKTIIERWTEEGLVDCNNSISVFDKRRYIPLEKVKELISKIEKSEVKG